MSTVDLTRWNPFDDRFLRNAMTRAWRPLQDVMNNDGLALDVYEKDGMMNVKATLPGLTHDDVKITVDDHVLTISAERKAENEVKEEDYYLHEVTTGAFRRSLRLPSDVLAHKAKATFDKGVLTITMPHEPKATRTPMEVKVQPMM